MAKYTMRMPKKKGLISKDDIYYEELIASGEYGGPIITMVDTSTETRYGKLVIRSSISVVEVLMYLGDKQHYSDQKHCKNIVDDNKLDGPWQNETDVEDMLLNLAIAKIKMENIN